MNTVDTVLLYAACAAAIAVAVYAERAHRRVRAERDRVQAELAGSRQGQQAGAKAYEEQYAEVQRLKGQLATRTVPDPWRERANEAADRLLAMHALVDWRDKWLQIAANELGTTYADVQYRHQAGDPEVTQLRWRIKERNFGAKGGMSPRVFATADAWHSKTTITHEEAKRMIRVFDRNGRAAAKGVNFGACRMQEAREGFAARVAAERRDGFPLQVDGTFIEVDYQQVLMTASPLLGKVFAMAEAEKAERAAKDRLDRAEAEHCSNVKRGAGEVCAIRDTYAKLIVAATKAREAYEAEMHAQTVTATL